MAVVVPALALSSACINLATVCPDGSRVLGACPPVHPASTAAMCHVVRNECLTVDPSTNLCLTTTPVTFNAITCGPTPTDACNGFCVNAGQPHTAYTTCSSTPTTGTVPSDPSYCNMRVGPGNFDVSCTIQGRECNVTPSGVTCLNLSSTVSTGNLTACEEDLIRPGENLCSNLPDNATRAIFDSRVVSATYTPHSGPCVRSSALTATDMSYGIPAGTPVPIAVAGQNVTLTTAGGHAVVSYRCDSVGELCQPYELKEFWLGMNPTTISGAPIKNVVFASVGSNRFKADLTLDPAGPGFRVSGNIDGADGVTYYKPAVPVKFSGSFYSTPFTFASTFDLPIKLGGADRLDFASAHVTMNLAGSTMNALGSPGGVQINCGDNGAVLPFVSDKDFTGGAGKTRANVIDLSGVINPAPMAVYQSQHYASPFTYTIPGFDSGSNHLIRLHFAETNPLNNAVGKRKFSVAINGTTQISNLDLFATVGMNKAYIKEFRLPASSAGNYVLSFTASADSATISAIEVL